MKKTIAAAILLFIALAPAASGQSSPATLEETITIDEVTEPTLLIRTSVADRYLQAPLVSTDIDVSVVGMLVRTTVTQTFTNPSSACVEGLYTFPLPEGSAIDELKLEVGSRVIEGVVRERAEARQVYEQAKTEGRRATLLEQHRPDLFTISVSSLGADETAKITIGFDDIVRYDSGVMSMRIPLVAAPRYQSRGASSARNVAQAAGRSMPFTLSVSLNAGLPVEEIHSASHAIETTLVSRSHWKIVVQEDLAIRDFHLDWRLVPGNEIRTARFASSDGGDQRHTLLMVVPPDERSAARMIPTERIFVLDTSGSMSGDSLREAKAALTRALRRLRGTDRFNVIEFNSITRRLYPSSERATESTIEEAIEWVEDRRADGGTEIRQAMAEALIDPDPLPGELRQVVFITDGLVTEEEAVARLLRKDLGRSRLFTVGIGSAPNGHFMQLIASEGRGSFTFISSPSQVESKMNALLTRLEAPALTGLGISSTDSTARVVPARIPDVYAGEPVMAIVRHRSPDPNVRLFADRESFETETRSAVVDAPDGQLARLWARWAIREASSGLYSGIPEDEVRERIVSLALDAGLVSRYTSLVAVDTSPGSAEACRAVRVPLSLPEGMNAAMTGVLPATATAGPLLTVVGAALLAAALLLLFQLAAPEVKS